MFRFTLSIAGLFILGYMVVLWFSAAQVRVPVAVEKTVAGGDAAHGEELFRVHGCNACHAIDGIRGADGKVGPYLGYFAEQSYIAGALPNQPDNLIAWIMNQQAIEPGTAMPNLDVSSSDARDIAAFLYALE